MESTRVDLISLRVSSIPNLALAVKNHEYGDLPIPSGATLVSCKEAFEDRSNDELLMMAFKVLSVKPRIKDIPVRVERTKLVVENVVNNETVDMFVLGLYSANVARLGVVEGDVAFVAGATVARTRVQPKQLQPTTWSVYVGQEIFRKEEPRCTLRFVRSKGLNKDQDLMESMLHNLEVDEQSVTVIPVPSTIKAIVTASHNVIVTNSVNDEAVHSDAIDEVDSDNVSDKVILPSSLVPVRKPEQNTALAKVDSDNVTHKVIATSRLAPVRKPQHNTPSPSRLAPVRIPQHCSPKVSKVYKYTELKQCSVHKARYNTWAVVKEVVELPTRRKTKLVARLLIMDESLGSWGDLAETYKFSVLANSMEAMPPLATGSVLRIHHMVAEVFNGVADGRVFDAGGVVVVEGNIGDNIKPVSTKQEIVWAETDEERVRELRQFYQELFVTDMKLEEIVGEVVCNLSCVVTAVITVEDGVVLRVADGTKHQLFTLAWKSPDSQEQELGGADFVDVYVTQAELLALIRNGQVGVGSYIKLTGLRCRQHRRLDSQGITMEYCDTMGNNVVGFEFVLEDKGRRWGGVEVLHGGDRRVEIIKQTIKDREEINKTDVDQDNLSVNNTDMDIDALIAAVNTDDTFDLPQDHSKILSPTGSNFKGRKMSDSSRESLCLPLGASSSPPRVSSPLSTPVLSPSGSLIPPPSKAPIPSPSTSPVPSEAPAEPQLRNDDHVDQSFVSAASSISIQGNESTPPAVSSISRQGSESTPPAVSSISGQGSLSTPMLNKQDIFPQLERSVADIDNANPQSKSIRNTPLQQERTPVSNIRNDSMQREEGSSSANAGMASIQPPDVSSAAKSQSEIVGANKFISPSTSPVLELVSTASTSPVLELVTTASTSPVLELVTSGDRKMVRKRGKVRRSAKEVQETSSQSYKDLGENDSQVSSMGFSDFQCLGSPVREKSESRSPVRLRQFKIKEKFTGPPHPREVQQVGRSRKPYSSK